MKVSLSKVLGALALCWAGAIAAHTDLAQSNPKNGAELSASPPVIEVQFKAPARLTSVVAVNKDKRERKLEFVAGDQPKTYRINKPQLEAGRNEIHWKALSADGHVVTGKLTYIIKAAASTK